MPGLNIMLIDIFNDIVAEQGHVVTEDREDLLRKINRAAKEIFNSTDLIGSTDEAQFDSIQDESILTFPWYVGKVRGARWSDSDRIIEIQHRANRYGSNRGNQVHNWQFRELAPNPLFRHIENESQLTVSIPVAESNVFIVTITGETDNSANTFESLTFAVGETEKTTTKNFKEPIRSITKNVITNSDVTITDVNDRIISIIPNITKIVWHQQLQILPNFSQTFGTNSEGIDFFYKKSFIPLFNDTDAFLGTDLYDQAIVWKYLEHGTKDVDKALGYLAKCNSVINQVAADQERGTRKRINFAANAFTEVTYKDYKDGFRDREF